jgi:hypothetical protein
MSILIQKDVLEIQLKNSERNYENLKDKKNNILQHLENIIRNYNSVLEGNCFYYHASLNLYPELYTKQINLFWCGQQVKKRICEIGFNAGHSAMLLLLGREQSDPIEFTVFDLGDHSYIYPCLQYIKKEFNQTDFEFIKGNSIETIPVWITENKEKLGTYDVIHIDGGHDEDCIRNDFKNCDLLIQIGGIIIIDDSDMPDIKKYIELYLYTGKYVELPVLPTLDYTHRIIQRIK